jgi:hypothetical protein
MKYGILGVLIFTLLTFGFSQKSIDISAYRIKMSNSDFEILRIKSPFLFSARKMYFQSQNDEYKLLEKIPNQIGCIVYVSFKPLSIIGDQIQYLETSRNDPGKNCALRNVGNVQVASYDFQNKRNTKITDFFSESDVIKNLLNDKIIQGFLNSKKPYIKSINELVEKLSDHNEKNCETTFDKNIIYNFSFHHIEGTKIAVRLWLSYMCGSVPADAAYKKGNLQIGLLLNPNQYTKQLIAEQKFIFTKDFETQKANPTIDFYYSVK